MVRRNQYNHLALDSSLPLYAVCQRMFVIQPKLHPHIFCATSLHIVASTANPAACSASGLPAGSYLRRRLHQLAPVSRLATVFASVCLEPDPFNFATTRILYRLRRVHQQNEVQRQRALHETWMQKRRCPPLFGLHRRRISSRKTGA